MEWRDRVTWSRRKSFRQEVRKDSEGVGGFQENPVIPAYLIREGQGGGGRIFRITSFLVNQPSSSDTEGIKPVIVEADSGRSPLVPGFAQDQGKAVQMEGLVPEILAVVEGRLDNMLIGIVGRVFQDGVKIRVASA